MIAPAVQNSKVRARRRNALRRNVPVAGAVRPPSFLVAREAISAEPTPSFPRSPTRRMNAATQTYEPELAIAASAENLVSRAFPSAGGGTRTRTPPRGAPDFKSGAYDQFRRPGRRSVTAGLLAGSHVLDALVPLAGLVAVLVAELGQGALVERLAREDEAVARIDLVEVRILVLGVGRLVPGAGGDLVPRAWRTGRRPGRRGRPGRTSRSSSRRPRRRRCRTG